MSHPGKDRKRSRLGPAAVILAFVLGYIIVGLITLDETTRVVPLIAGGVTLALLVIDILRVFLGDGPDDDYAPEGGGVLAVRPQRELAAILFVAGGVTTIYLAGFLVAIPLYLFASIAFLGRQPIRTAAIVAVITTLIVYVVFEVLLAYELYPGLLFD